MYRGSIHDFPDFDPNQDAEALYTAMKGFGGCRPPKSGSHGEEGAWKVSSTPHSLPSSHLLVFCDFS